MTQAADVTPEHAERAPRAFWPRAAFMLLFIILFAVAETVLFLVTVLQALWLAFTGAANPHMTRFGASLARWLAEVGRFQSCASDEKPYPFAAWPSDPAQR